MQETILKNGRQYPSHPVYPVQVVPAFQVWDDPAQKPSPSVPSSCPDPNFFRSGAELSPSRIPDPHKRIKVF